MFKSKLIGWITASTLLCVAGVAIACRLQEGSGRMSDGLPVAWASADETPAPPAPPTETTPLPTPVPEAVPTPVESTPPPLPEVQIPPPPPPSAAVPVVVEKPEAKATPLPTPPVESSAVPPPKPQVGEIVSEPVRVAIPDQTPVAPKVEADPAVTQVAPVSEPIAVKKEVATPAPVVTPPKPEGADSKNYWAEQGDTLRGIARKRLGNEDRWMEIERLNPELRARTIIPTGTLVRMPIKDDVVVPAPMGGQAESEFVTPETRSTVKPLPVIRSKPEYGKSETPLIGTFECKVDEKGVIVLPKEIREQLGRCDNVYLTPGPDQCLWLVSESGRMRVRQRVEKAAIDDDEVLAFRRLYFSQTRKVGVDAASRLSVPESFCDYAKFTGTVIIIGSDDHFELWDATRWQRYSQEKGTTLKTPRGTED